MTTPFTAPGCANCTQARESDIQSTVARLSQKYGELAASVARYVQQADDSPARRSLTAVAVAQELGRIVGGFETQPGAYPDCALIGHQYPNGSFQWFCSGVLVFPDVVLTAAHCHQGINVVALNAVNVQSLEDAEIIGVRKMIVNPLWKQGVNCNDIAVLVLRREARVRPVPPATATELAGSSETTLVGFGNNDLNSTKGFGIQREVAVDILHVRRGPADDLDAAEQTLGFESDCEFVAGGSGYDSCNGDSGGPAYITVGGTRRVAGLTSRSTTGATTPCGDGGIYTRVDTQLAFIDKVRKVEKKAKAPTQWSPSSLFR
jgi:endonuclease G